MSQPSGIPTTPDAGVSVIHDIGYRPYAGPRHGLGGIARALIVTGFRNAFGLGRSGRSKILPFVLLALNLAPALAIAGVVVLVGLDALPISYARYAAQTQVLLAIFVASQAPVLFSRDLRHGTIALYLARPLPAPIYALARWVALLGATLVFLLLPILILYAVALLGEFDLTEQTRQAGVAVVLVLLLLDEPFNGVDPRQRMHLMALLRRMGAEGRTLLFSSHILEEVEQVARQIEVVVAGRHAASGDFGVIRRLMTDRPMQYAVVADDDRRLGSVLIADPSVIGVSLRRQGGLDVSVSDLGAFAVRLPRMARENGIRILELTPSDESLESVFAYLVGGPA